MEEEGQNPFTCLFVYVFIFALVPSWVGFARALTDRVAGLSV